MTHTHTHIGGSTTPQAATLATTFHFADAAALLPALVDVAAARPAPPPTSGYRVGAAGLGASGAVYLGANLELPAAPLAASVHAEQVREEREGGFVWVGSTAFFFNTLPLSSL